MLKMVNSLLRKFSFKFTPVNEDYNKKLKVDDLFIYFNSALNYAVNSANKKF